NSHPSGKSIADTSTSTESGTLRSITSTGTLTVTRSRLTVSPESSTKEISTRQGSINNGSGRPSSSGRNASAYAVEYTGDEDCPPTTSEWADCWASSEVTTANCCGSVCRSTSPKSFDTPVALRVDPSRLVLRS